ncbi:MAG: hypothetical protein MRK02_15835 [Candidatus Scalindua sp.]|nr:hypothetical protein [Candidatus Scalindua sp.]
MFKKSCIVIALLLAIAFAGKPIGMSTDTVLAHGHKQYGCKHCRDCGHYVCPGDCGKCEECLARQRAVKEAAEKCAKCGHLDCSDNCDYCVDCLNERIKKLEKELEKGKD